MDASRFIRCLLIPAFLLANLFCLCVHASAAMHTIGATPPSAKLDCCGRLVGGSAAVHSEDHRDFHSDERSKKGDHESTCPHCRDKTKIVADASGGDPLAHALHPLSTPVSLDKLLTFIAPRQVRLPRTVLIAPAPPPGRLHLHCILQV